MDELNFKFVSAEKYSKLTGLGVEEVKRLCKINKLEHEMTEGGYYKIKVYKNDCVSKSDYERVKQENIEMKTTLENIKKIMEVG